jgi:hypothetical protein
MDLTKVKTKALFEKFSLDEPTVLFTGHALALHFDDAYVRCSAQLSRADSL